LEKDYFEASQWLLSNILQRQPQNAQASYWLGELYLEKGETKPGIEYIYNAAKIDSKNLEYRFRLGQALAENELYEEATKHLKSVIKASKGSPIALKAKKEMAHASGRVLIQKGHYEKAYKHFQDAEKLYKSGFTVDVAESLILLKKYKKAQKLLAKIIDSDSQNYKAHGLMAKIYKKQGNISKHLEHLDLAWLGSPGEGLKSSSIVNLGLKDGFDKLKSKTWGDAIIAFNRALNHDPNNLYAVLGKHAALYNSGNIEEAEKLMGTLMSEKEKTIKAKLKFLEVRSLVSQ
jgi:tetratricopeptide (TPR) repeat protein